MPPPISRYQPPAPLFGSIAAIRHSRNSSACVPLRSPRDTKATFASAILLSAATASCPPAICAGSAAGPTMTKSFHAVCRRPVPCPSAMNCSSASGSCTRTRSASARRACRAPVPCPAPAHAPQSGLACEDWQDRAEEPGIVERGRRRQQDGVGRHLGRARIRQPYPCRDKREQPQPDASHALGRPASPNAAALIITVSPISTSPSPSASGRSPLLVSSTIAVVIVRV